MHWLWGNCCVCLIETTIVCLGKLCLKDRIPPQTNTHTHTAALLKMPLSLYCSCKAQCSVGLSLCSCPLGIVQVMNVLNEVASVTTNGLVCCYLSRTK